MSVSPEKKTFLLKRMENLGIEEDDLLEKFILGSGKGGQKVNKSASCVYLKHLPTGIEVKCQKERSRALNRYFARRLLCDKIEEIRFQKHSEKQRLIAKIRKQKKRRSKRLQDKLIEDKRKRSHIKTLRSNPHKEED